MDKSKKKSKVEYTKKERAVIAVMSSLTISFIVFLSGSLVIYFNNYREYMFSLEDFIFPLLGIFIASFALLSFLLYLCRGRAIILLSQMIFIFITWSYIDTGIINKVSFVSGDVNRTGNVTLSLITLFVIFNIFYFISVKFAKSWKSIVLYLSVLFIAMNSANLVSTIIKSEFSFDNQEQLTVLSNAQLNEVSDKENIIVFIVDRFDNKYFSDVEEAQPGFFDSLQGFTYYNDSISLYPRTFPSIAYLFSGEKYTGEVSPSQYLDSYAQNSDYLKDLKSNNYNIRYYTQLYYGYNNANSMADIVDNEEEVVAVRKDTAKILKYLIKFSAARNISLVLQTITYVSQNQGETLSLVNVECENGLFACNDYEMYKSLNDNGLTVSGNDKDYIFIHLHGSHTPYTIDENCELSSNSDATKQTMGCFKYIYKYLDELKRIGAYDNSTIIITGDHGISYTDKIGIEEWQANGIDNTSTTALLYKPREAENTQLQRSSLPVSAENIIPTIIEDAKINTSKTYGLPISHINADNPEPRNYVQLIYSTDTRKLSLYEYSVNGKSDSFDSWERTNIINTPYIWY